MEDLQKFIDSNKFSCSEQKLINEIRYKTGQEVLTNLFLKRNKSNKDPEIVNWYLQDEENWNSQIMSITGNNSTYYWGSFKLWNTEQELKPFIIHCYLEAQMETEENQVMIYFRISDKGDNTGGVMNGKEINYDDGQYRYPCTNTNVLYGSKGYMLNMNKVWSFNDRIMKLGPQYIASDVSNKKNLVKDWFYLGYVNNKWIFGNNIDNIGYLPDINNPEELKNFVIHFGPQAEGTFNYYMGFTAVEENVYKKINRVALGLEELEYFK